MSWGRRNRGRLDAGDEVAVLRTVKARLEEGQKDPSKSFKGIREEVAAALKARNFDDGGIGCDQEKRLSGVIAGICNLEENQQDQVGAQFQSQPFEKQKKIMDEAILTVQ